MQHSQALDLEEALARLGDDLPRASGHEEVPLTDSIGRVLAAPVRAPVDLPPFPASAMDGYAVCEPDDGGAYQLRGTSLAGHPWSGTLQPGECVRIFTGAEVPQGATRVIVQEDLAHQHAQSVHFTDSPAAEKYIRPIGHDVRAGTELAPTGTQINPFHVGTFAAAGIASVTVLQRLRVGVFSTGDELADPGVTLGPGQIYDSNRLAVLTLLRDTPVQLLDLGRLPDDAAATQSALRDAADRCDVLITSGGVSVGDADHVTDAIRTLGELGFWKLNLKPGKPLAFGRIGACRIFGLPGNPVSTIVTLLLIAKPALMFMGGLGSDQPKPAERLPARLAVALAHTPGRTEYQRGWYDIAADEIRVSDTGDQSSNRMSTFTRANCFIEVPAAASDLPAGAPVRIIPFWSV